MVESALETNGTERQAKKEEAWTQFKDCNDYRSFLRIYLEQRTMSCSQFAKLSGFARGYAADVISGRRRLTAKTYPAFEQALKVPSSGKKFFRLLVAVAEPDLFPDLKKPSIPKQIDDLRAKSWESARREVEKSNLSNSLESLFLESELIAVWAAAGAPSNGARIAEIKIRTGLPEAVVSRSLQKLAALGIVVYDENKNWYEPKDSHFFFRACQHSEIFIKYFKQAAQNACQRVVLASASEQELFISSTFCVDKEKLPELKKALKKLLLDFVDESIQPNGNQIVKLVSALHL